MRETSNGCSRWEACGGRHNKTMPLFRAMPITSIFFVWVECLSSIRRTIFSLDTLENCTNFWNYYEEISKSSKQFHGLLPMLQEVVLIQTPSASFFEEILALVACTTLKQSSSTVIVSPRSAEVKLQLAVFLEQLLFLNGLLSILKWQCHRNRIYDLGLVYAYQLLH